MKKDEAIASRIDRVAEIEAQIDPSLRRRGRVVADLVTLAVVTPIAMAFDFHVTRPSLMVSLMAAALALNQLIPLITERRLRGERKRLLTEAEMLESGTGRGPVEGD